ncbi:MAG: hypothetical protein RLO18_25740, partial [Gimesia chilikensis]
GLGENEDLVVLVNNQLQIFTNSIQPRQDDRQFLGALGYTRQRNSYEINLRDIIGNISIRGNTRLDAVAGRSPQQVFELQDRVVNGDVLTALLNDDAIDDMFVFTSHSHDAIRGVLLLSSSAQGE